MKGNFPAGYVPLTGHDEKFAKDEFVLSFAEIREKERQMEEKFRENLKNQLAAIEKGKMSVRGYVPLTKHAILDSK